MAEEILVGSVGVEVRPDTDRFSEQVRAQLTPQAAKLGQEIGAAIAKPITAKMQAAVRQGLKVGTARDGAKAGNEWVDAFAKAAGSKAAKVGAQVGEAMARPLAERVREGVSDGMDGGTAPAKTKGSRTGEEFGGAFATAARRRIQAALRALPKAEITIDSTDADRELAAVRAELAALGDRRIGVDIDTTAALAQIGRLSATLDRLGAETTDVSVRADTAAASAELAKIVAQVQRLAAEDATVDVDADTLAANAALAGTQAMVDRLAASRPSIRVDADTAGASAQFGLATSRLGALIAAGITLAPLIAPAAGVAAGAVAAIGAAALSSVAGVGVLALAFNGVFEAVGALNDHQAEAGKRAADVAAKQVQIAAAVDAVRGAEAGLANARAAAADAAARASRQIADAQEAATRAREAATAQVEQATRRLVSAERTLQTAQEGARRAQLALTEARLDARRQLEDLNNQVAGAALAQRRATLAVEEAKRDLDRVLMDPVANQYQRDQAQLTYDEAVQRLEEVRLENTRLAADKAKADKAGVEGSRQVQAAQDGVRNATQRVADAQQGVRDAHAGVVQAQQDGAQRIAEAQQKVADAVAAQVVQQRQSAFAIASAQRGVISAQRSLQQATTAAGTSGAASMDKLNKAMGALSPTGQNFARFLFGLKPVLDRLKAAAEGGLLPGVERGIRAMLPLVPSLERFIGSLASTMGDLFEEGGKALASPFWQDFFAYMARTAGPIIKDVARFIGGLIRAFATLLIAFEPFTLAFTDGLGDMGEGLVKLVADFVESDGFKEFIDYLLRNGPMLGKLFLDLSVVVLKLLVALAPFGEVMLQGLVVLFDWLASLDPSIILAIAGAIAVVVAAVAGPVAAVIGVVIAFVGLWVLAYNRLDWFRKAVDTWFKAIATVALWLWNNALKPAFTAIADFTMNQLVPAVLWLWRNAIQPAFAAIAAVISWAWNRVIKPTFDAIWFVITRVLAPVFQWLYRNVIKPVWSAIWIAIQLAWVSIRVVFGLIQIALRILGAVFSWLYRNAIKPAWDAISGVISNVWRTKIRPIFETLGSFIQRNVAPAFSRGVDAIRKAWEKVQDAAKKPVGFVLKTVIEGGILRAYNAVASKFPGVSPVHLPKDLLAKFSTGGVVPGYAPGRDVVPALVSPGEGWIVPEAVRGLASEMGTTPEGAIRRINAAYSRRVGGPSVQDGRMAFAGGGIVPQLTAFARKSGVPFNVTSGVRNTRDNHGRGLAIDMASSPGNMVRLAAWLYGRSKHLLELIHSAGPGYFVKRGKRVGASFYRSVIGQHYNHVHLAATLAGLSGADVSGGGDGGGFFDLLGDKISAPLNAALAKLPGKDSPFGKLVAGVPRKAAGFIADKARNLLSSIPVVGNLFDGDRGAKPSGGLSASVTRWTSTVVQALSQLGQPLSLVPAVLRRIKLESGGNPKAINLWDSNARAGHPSQGLMQTIPGTFRAYAGSYRGRGITDPLANIFAGLNYALRRYGSIQAIDPLIRPYGYDSGGWLMPGLTVARNDTGKPEAILTHEQWQAIQAGRGGGAMTIRVLVDDGAVKGLVRVEVDEAFGSLADAQVYGTN